MAKVILGKKLGMTQIFTEEGKVVPVTVVESGKNVVLQSKLLKLMATMPFRLALEQLKKKM